MVNELTGIRVSYGYDEFSNLVWTNQGDQFDFLHRSVDDVGNLYETKEKTDRIYGAGSRLLETREATFSYDEEGNLIQKVEKNGDTWKYEYNGNGMMAKVIRPDNTEVTFKYDSLGRRIEKSSDDKTTSFVWDGNTILHEYFSEEALVKLENDSLVTWVFNDGFVPSAKITNDSNYSIISDYLGTPVEAYDNEGNKVWSAELDIYGRVKEFLGSKDFIPFRYQGQYHDVETGLYYNRFRYYSPDDGCYTQVDPIGLAGGNPTLYGYVGDPNTTIDPFGLINEFDIEKYGIFNAPSNVGDGLTGHELLQNGWLKHNLGTKRMEKPLSYDNPSIALHEKPIHQNINRAQRKYGLYDKNVLKRQSALTNINRNAAITRRAIMEDLVNNRGMSLADAKKFATDKVMELRDQAIGHGKKHGLIPCKS